MGIQQILKSRRIIVTVPDRRKAEAVRNALEGPVTPRRPASILQQHENCFIFLDEPAASLLIAISTEMLLSADGLGSYIVRAQESFRIADGMAALLFIAFLSLAINGAAGWLDHRLLEWNYLRRASGDS